MRVTVNIPDTVGSEAAEVAKQTGMSVSALYAQAIERYIHDLRRQEAFKTIRDLIGKRYVTDDVLEELERDRTASDRNDL